MTTSTSNEVLLIAPVMDNLLARLEAAFVVHRLYEQEDAAAFLAEKVRPSVRSSLGGYWGRDASA